MAADPVVANQEKILENQEKMEDPVVVPILLLVTRPSVD
jgi:hypothetical protein